MDVWQRRAVLDPRSNPDRNMDVVSSLVGGMAVLDGRVDLTLRYVPDALTVTPDAFAAYLKSLEAIDWPSHENLAATVVQDFNNELVPRWVQVVTRRAAAEDGAPEHKVLVEDSQPGWDNQALLARLDPV